MRRRYWLLFNILLATACQATSEPPMHSPAATASQVSASSDPSVDQLAELRAGNNFDEFAQHVRAAKADGARLAWENFAPIVDGQRVEWTNKAELWDSIAPKIRDEALLLGPEYAKPLWNNRNAIPNGIEMGWSDAKTEGRGQYVELVVTYSSELGPAERVWAVLVKTGEGGLGRVDRWMDPFDVAEGDFANAADAFESIQARTWTWIFDQGEEGE